MGALLNRAVTRLRGVTGRVSGEAKIGFLKFAVLARGSRKADYGAREGIRAI